MVRGGNIGRGDGATVVGKGRALNAYGRRGVQLVLDDGTRILLGSQRPEELMAALDTAARLAAIR